MHVKDHGSGIPKEIQSQIFEPFFSTKGDASTGIGLSIVTQIMRDMGGEISVDSIPEVGTTFTLKLPHA